MATEVLKLGMTLLSLLVAVSGLYWRLRVERIRAEEKRDSQIAAMAASTKNEIDQLRDQVQASERRMSELDADSQRAIGRVEGILEAMRESK